MTIDKSSELARQFLEQSESQFIKNDKGNFRYQSQDCNHQLNLDGVFSDFIDWLIENNFVTEK